MTFIIYFLFINFKSFIFLLHPVASKVQEYLEVKIGVGGYFSFGEDLKIFQIFELGLNQISFIQK